MQADVTLLTVMTGSTNTGLYSPASGLVNALFIIPATVFLMVVPLLSRQFADDPQRMLRTYRKLMLGFLGLGTALALGVGLAGGWIVRVLLGPQYLVTSVLFRHPQPAALFQIARVRVSSFSGSSWVAETAPAPASVQRRR